MTGKEILTQLTLEEKASLCSGANFWQLKSVERLGLTSIMVTDGPHGLRKQTGESDHLGVNKSISATCFPTASATASSWDRDLMREIGEAIGEECLKEDVAVVLGPGANIKRSPLCGRNFEYISEDPFLTGEIASALIQGVQSKGVGTSLKHYALNNQEHLRMVSDSVVDERAMREIYLAGFEMAVKQSQPYTVMCSYNRVNGVYTSENKRLLTDILRGEWGFDGLVVTDWGAANDRVEGVKAGLDLEMPSSGGYNDAAIVTAVNEGTLAVEVLDSVVLRVIELVLKTQDNKGKGYTYNQPAHHLLARKAAAESMVLLKNEDDVLPLSTEKKLAVIGKFAKQPRYQGAGSSKINPHKIDSSVEELEQLGIEFTYTEGYSLDRAEKPVDTKQNEAKPDDVKLDDAKIADTMIAEAVAAAKSADAAIIFAGLPDEYESEGFDRKTLSMPESHNRLIEAVAAANRNTVVVLQMGAPVDMPWKDAVKGIVLSYLGGEASGSAAIDVLYGKVNPSGHLAESFPFCLDDVPCAEYFAGDRMNEEYRESIFVGYRFFDKVKKEVLFPFGFGLSYTSFAFSNLVLSKNSLEKGDRLTVSVDVENTGKCAGAEVVQLYAGKEQETVYRADKELKGFEKVYLEAAEKKTVTISLNDRSFSYYNREAGDWAIEGGEYSILVGASSRDIAQRGTVKVKGDGKEQLLEKLKDSAPIYYNLPDAGRLSVPSAQFESVFGGAIPKAPSTGRPFSVNSTLGDVRKTLFGKRLYKMIVKQMMAMFPEGSGDTGGFRRMAEAMIDGMPLRALSMMSGGSLDPVRLQKILKLLNGFRKAK